MEPDAQPPSPDSRGGGAPPDADAKDMERRRALRRFRIERNQRELLLLKVLSFDEYQRFVECVRVAFRSAAVALTAHCVAQS